MAPRSAAPEAGFNLALAMVAVSEAPLLLLNGKFDITAASASFCRAFDIDPDTIDGRRLFQLGDGEWNIPQLRSLLKSVLVSPFRIEAYEMDLKRAERPTRRLSLKANRLNSTAEPEAQLLLTVLDVTERLAQDRLREDLARENAVLLKELQHRIANSLQIIASILLHSARKVHSDESRMHLHDAHNRVMSVAAVQRQLAASYLDEVELRPYFTELCSSLGASMIADHTKVEIEVATDEATVSAQISVILGLIVTELVINALKHAFPSGRAGKIVVAYAARGPNWTLSVDDDGVGVPSDAKPGLGTGIIEALIKQLNAHSEITTANPGTSVRVFHTQIAIVRDGGA